MTVHTAVDQGHADAGAGVTRLPRDFRVNRRRRNIEGGQRPVRADVNDIRLIREVHDAGAIYQSYNAVDQRQLAHDVQEIAYHAIHQPEQPAATGLGSGLGSRRILHDYLHRLAGVISLQFG